MDRGVLYIASGESYISEAERSAKTLKQHNPSLPITIYCDEKPDNDIFDSVLYLKDSINDMGDSILSEEYFPYEKNLYIDVDTHICGSLQPVFDLIDRYDMALARDTGNGRRNSEIYDMMENSIPDPFIEYNSGVIAYTDTQQVRDLFSLWNRIYNKTDFDTTGFKTNQPALTYALYDGDVEFVTLPPEYNFQLNQNRFARSSIKIIHRNGGTKIDLERFEKYVNSRGDCRIISLEDYPCRVFSANHRSWKYRLKKISSRDTWKRLKQEAKEEQGEEGIIPFLKFSLSKFNRMI